MKRSNSSVYLCGLALLSSLTVTATTFNAAQDFSGNSNPNGVWGYGYANTLGGFSPFLTYAAESFPGYGFPTLSDWRRSLDNSEGYPRIYFNSSSSPLNAGDALFPANSIALHPGPTIDDQFAILRFTAPVSANYRLSSQFTMISYYGPGASTDVHVLHNGQSLFSGNVIGYGTTASHLAPMLSLQSGDTLDFAVGYLEDYFGDSTGISVKLVSRVADSSDSWVLLGATLVLIRFTRRIAKGQS